MPGFKRRVKQTLAGLACWCCGWQSTTSSTHPAVHDPASFAVDPWLARVLKLVLCMVGTSAETSLMHV
eukprot:2831726-Pleurochrysis_carterae.AAC.1